MSAKEMPPPPRNPLGRAPELVGPDEGQVDVSHWDPRQIAVTALDTSLKAHEDVRNGFAGVRLELGGIKDDVALIREHLGIPVDAVPPRPPPVIPGSYRDPDASMADATADLAKADALLRERARNRRDPMTSDQVRAFAKEVLTKATEDRELATWRSLKTWPARIGWEGLKVLVGLVVGGAAIEFWHWLAHH